MIKCFNIDRVKMILFWVTLLLLHQGYTLVPVITVQLGEPVTFTCPFPERIDSRSKIHWYKQNVGDSLSLMVKFQKFLEPEYRPGFSASELNVMDDDRNSNLTILKTTHKDEGMYHCAFINSNKNTWHSIYLSIKGKNEKTSNFTVVQPEGYSKHQRGNSLNLQCSVYSDSTNKRCSEDLSVFWFRARSNESYPHIIYTDGNYRDECEKKTDFQNRCVFSKNIKSSDPRTYYCAVATCGQILIGEETKVEHGQTAESILLVVALICLAISLVVNIIFLCYRTPRAGMASTPSQARQPRYVANEGGQDLDYTELHFSGRKGTRGKKRELKTDESVYSRVKL